MKTDTESGSGIRRVEWARSSRNTDHFFSAWCPRHESSVFSKQHRGSDCAPWLLTRRCLAAWLPALCVVQHGILEERITG